MDAVGSVSNRAKRRLNNLSIDDPTGFLRRKALGRLSEILGAEALEQDRLMRTAGLNRIVAYETAHLPAETKGLLESFTRGVNALIEDSREQLPIEFALLDYEPEPFSVRDSIAILRGEWWSLNGRLYTLAIGEAAERLPAHLRSISRAPRRRREPLASGSFRYRRPEPDRR